MGMTARFVLNHSGPFLRPIGTKLSPPLAGPIQQEKIRYASSWHYNQRNSTTFGGTSWHDHHANLYSGSFIGQREYEEDNIILKVLTALIATFYVGGKIAQKAAALLEENEIFVHTDEDDED